MQKENFWSRLKKEEKIKTVEPSEEVKESYLRKSESNLSASKLLLDNNFLEEAVTSAYYSMYNLVLALLFKTGIKSENHTASIIFLKDIYSRENTLILNAKRERIDKQYYVDFKITREDVTTLIKDAEEFNSYMLDFISKISNNEMQEARKKFKQVLDKY